MIRTIIGKDYIEIDEKNWDSEEFRSIKKIHLIKMNFIEPTVDKINRILKKYPNTNRFVVDNNIRLYNDVLKKTIKKYYVENNVNDNNILSFFRKNNKILFNFNNLSDLKKRFFLDNFIFYDILHNVEVVRMAEEDFDEKYDIIKNWNGNVIVY